MYTDRRRGLVIFVKSPPLEPPSPMQTHMRNQFRRIALLWRYTPDEQKAKWKAIVDTLSLSVTHYNLFTWWHMKRDRAAIETLERQSGITVL